MINDACRSSYDRLFLALAKWLDYDGLSFFLMCIKTYGTVAPVWTEWVEKPPENASRLEEAILRAKGEWGSGIPHPVHFREGMAVRNFLRSQPECECWDAHDLDDVWMLIVIMTLVKCEVIDIEDVNNLEIYL